MRVHAPPAAGPSTCSPRNARSSPLPPRPYDTRIVRTVRASPLCRVRFEGNTYSVPPERAGRTPHPEGERTPRSSVYVGAEEVARHPRSPGRGQDVVDPAHVRALLDTKHRGERGAVVHRFLALWSDAADLPQGA